MERYQESRRSRAKFLENIENDTIEELMNKKNDLRMQLFKANAEKSKLQNPYNEKLNVKEIKKNIARIDTFLKSRNIKL